MNRLIFLVAVVFSVASVAARRELVCFPQYSEHSCNPRVSFSAVIPLPPAAPEVFVQKYQPGITLGIFSGPCIGSLDDTLTCTDPENDGIFLVRKIGAHWAATFNGDALSPEIWKCRRE